MKKIIALLLAFCLMCGVVTVLASCDGEDGEGGAGTTEGAGTTDPEVTTEPEETTESLTKEEIFAAALSKGVKATGELDDVNMKMDVKLAMKAEGMTMEMPMEIIIKAKDADSATPELYMKTYVEMFGEKAEMEIFRKDGWDYMVENGEGYKQKVDPTEDSDDLVGDAVPFLPALDENILTMSNKGIEYLDQFDGSKKITMSFNDAQYKEHFAELVESMTSEYQGTIVDSYLTLTIDGGYLVGYETGYVLKATIEGIAWDISVIYDIEFVDPGKPVTITLPDGYQNFPNIEDMFETNVDVYA